MIQTTATMSTAHVTEKDNDLFEEKIVDANIPFLARYDGGWVFYKSGERYEMEEELALAGLSRHAIALFDHVFFEIGADMLRLDADANRYDRMPVFDW